MNTKIILFFNEGHKIYDLMKFFPISIRQAYIEAYIYIYIYFRENYLIFHEQRHVLALKN